MKKNKIYITLLSGLLACSFVSAEEVQKKDTTDKAGKTLLEQIVVPEKNGASHHVRAEQDLFERSQEYDVVKALYGTIPGLTAFQGSGSNAQNFSSLSIHGSRPLILIDGFERSLDQVTASEIGSVTVYDDAVASAIYGVRGANGVILITTKRGSQDKLKITADYTYGFGKMFRKPEFADSYTYGTYLNEALALDGLASRYNDFELQTLKNGDLPFFYPNVDWMKETMKDLSQNHRMKLTFDGGSDRFRYYSVIDYMYDDSFWKNSNTDDRYNPQHYNTTLGLRANIDVDITKSTFMKLGTMVRLSQSNEANTFGLMNAVYRTPSAAFPVVDQNGVYGGSSIYKAANPYAMLNSTGAYSNSKVTVLADLNLKQDFSAWVKGLSADLTISFDYIGDTADTSSKEYRYSEYNPTMLPDGTVVFNPIIYGKDSQTLGHSHWLDKCLMRSEFQAKINYVLNDLKGHNFDAHAIYHQRSYTSSVRNQSSKTQTMMLTANYNYKNRYFVNLVANWSGTSYLKKGERFNFYPAASLAWELTNEEFMQDVPVLSKFRIFASAGLSGSDRRMEHELHIQSYGGANAGGYYFTHDAESSWGQAEGNLPVENLSPELAKKVFVGADIKFFDDRLSVYGKYFAENRSHILVNARNVSEIIGIGVNRQCTGEENYQGVDLALSWNDKVGDFRYGIYANGSYLTSKIINNGQAYQRYEYLRQAGRMVGQASGLEVIGIFQNQYEINNSPVQTFMTVKPGDFKYKDQNNDGVINDEDEVKMFGTTIPMFNCGFGLNFGYKGFDISADFQARAGVTVSLLDSPLYRPLVENGNISKTFLDREVTWTPERASEATMPRLTTVENSNNYRNNSFWYRDGSFLKLRNLTLSYTFSRSMLKVMDMKIYASGMNLFSVDKIGFVDPEQIEGGYPTSRTFWFGVKFTF